MKKLGVALCGLLLALAACVETASDDAAAENAIGERSEEITGAIDGAGLAALMQRARVASGASTQAVTCTTTSTACVRAKCGDHGPGVLDDVHHETTTCCSDTGVCTSERHRICGCP